MSNAFIQARDVFVVSGGKLGYREYRFDNIVCDNCEMAFFVLCAGRACHCPVCGARLEFPMHAKAPEETMYEVKKWKSYGAASVAPIC